MQTLTTTMFATAAILTGLVIPVQAQQAARGVRRGREARDRTQDDPRNAKENSRDQNARKHLSDVDRDPATA